LVFFDVGCSGLFLFRIFDRDESKLPLQEPKEKRVSMNEAERRRNWVFKDDGLPL
jgi:hypothetical protein